MDMVVKFGGDAAVDQVAKKVGLNEQVTKAAVGALLPAIASGIQSNLGKDGGAESLMGALTKGNHSQYLDEPAKLADDSASQDGNGILGHILGNKDVSRMVAASVAQAVGIENETAKKLLPVAAAMAMAGLAKKTQEEKPAAAAGPDLAKVLGGLLGF